MMASYMHALEMQARWQRYGREQTKEWLAIFKPFVDNLEHSDTFFMNKNFCALVDYARRTMPDEQPFEESWMLSPVGFLWLETPFLVPTMDTSRYDSKRAPVWPSEWRISAIGWKKVSEKVCEQAGSYNFMCYHENARLQPGADGFDTWSEFVVKSGFGSMTTLKDQKTNR